MGDITIDLLKRGLVRGATIEVIAQSIELRIQSYNMPFRPRVLLHRTPCQSFFPFLFIEFSLNLQINENLEHVQHGSIQLTIKMAADAAQSRRDSTAKIASLSAEDEKKVREEAAATLKKEVAESQRKIQDADKDIRSVSSCTIILFSARAAN